ncbi:hypothetical protein [Actinoplanes sp. N902-109]|uniref:hypothetical protein n=1 Tax=Actinoplanes sp. (strain N902-109) TaxID=649831 RepID=UPI0003295849|nr:hypothetical protein [Actinoplanes sp. N902-109]AGL18764.1 hypothetical protein L083_5254 [Actinoplanes sp. N902-109]
MPTLPDLTVLFAADVLAFSLLRYVLPRLLRAGREPARQSAALVCAVLLLPELLYTRQARRHGRPPHRAAHDYGALVTTTAVWACNSLTGVAEGVVRACTGLHWGVVALATTGGLIWLTT